MAETIRAKPDWHSEGDVLDLKSEHLNASDLRDRLSKMLFRAPSEFGEWREPE